MKRNLRYITIIVGCLLAVVIVCLQVYTSQSKSVSATEQSDDSSDDSQGATITMASFSLPSPINVQINLDPHCLFEIVFESVTNDVPQTTIPSIEEKFFVTLFRVFIAPNAP